MWKIRSFFQHPNSRLDEEFAFHLDQLKRQFVAKGMSEADAEREARRQFGNRTSLAEAYKDQRGVPWLQDFLSDLRHAARMLLRNPGFATIAVLTLALGIGANTAIFSLVNAAYLRSAPYANAGRLVDIVHDRGGRREGDSHNSRRYMFWKERARSFEHLGAWRGGGDLTLIAGGEAQQVRTIRVSANFFDLISVKPVLGRTFTPEEDRPGGPDVVILSWGLWQSRYGGDPQILTRSINLGGKLASVAGVLGRDFSWLTPRDLWMPLQAKPSNDGSNTGVFGLLRPGVTFDQASREVGDLLEQYRREYPDEEGEFSPGERAAVTRFDSATRQNGKPLLILFGAVGLTLLIACANLGNLLVARATGRIREVAIRATLGAGRGRIVRQMLAESMLIALAGAAGGVALAYVLLPGLRLVSPVSFPAWEQLSVDWTVLGFTACIAIFTGLLFGAFPAWQASRLDLHEAIKEGGSKGSAGRKTGRLREIVVATEVALSLMLLVGAGLFLRTFANLMSVNSGVDSTNVMTAQMPLQGEKYATRSATAAMVRRGLERLRALPGVESAAVVTNLPMERGLNLVTWVPGTADPDGPKLTDWRYVTTDYFSVMRIPLVAGRLFTAADNESAEAVALVNQEFVRRYFKGENPVGRTMQVLKQSQIPDRLRIIVGVVGDVKSEDLRRRAPATTFVPLEQAPDSHIQIANSFFQAGWVVRTRGASQDFAGVLQRELKAVDPMQPVSGVRTLDDIRSNAVKSERSMMILLGGFALLALLLAAAGIYGVIAYSVAQRSREIGIRMALGATAGEVVRSIVGQGAIVAAIGVLAGVAGALGLSRLVSGLVFGIKPNDPLTMVTASLVLLVIALVASAAPALKAARTDPSLTLRAE